MLTLVLGVQVTTSLSGMPVSTGYRLVMPLRRDQVDQVMIPYERILLTSFFSSTRLSKYVGVVLPRMETSSPAELTVLPPGPSTSWMFRLRRVMFDSLPASLANRFTPERGVVLSLQLVTSSPSSVKSWTLLSLTATSVVPAPSISGLAPLPYEPTNAGPPHGARPLHVELALPPLTGLEQQPVTGAERQLARPGERLPGRRLVLARPGVVVSFGIHVVRGARRARVGLRRGRRLRGPCRHRRERQGEGRQERPYEVPPWGG